VAVVDLGDKITLLVDKEHQEVLVVAVLLIMQEHLEVGGSGNTPSVAPSQGNNGGTGYGADPYGGGGGGGAGQVGSAGSCRWWW
jgi:hypothetical protein